MEEDLDVLQRVGGGTGDVWQRPGSAQSGDHPAFIQLTVDPREMPQARRGERTDLAIVVFEQPKVQFLQLSPVPVAVQGGADHGVQRGRQVAAVERGAYLIRCRWWRVVEDMMLVTHRRIVPHPALGRVARVVALGRRRRTPPTIEVLRDRGTAVAVS
ncbi:hypothetical protein [Micromonospora sp. NPDC005197]|uniref:hypothetical protein n=1 Tax=Micromonospora sp. NPDC005197 TaxID=3157020 RepID=UPI00339FDA66